MQTPPNSSANLWRDLSDSLTQLHKTTQLLALKYPEAAELLLLQQATEPTPGPEPEPEWEFDAQRRQHIAELKVRSYFDKQRNKQHEVLPLEGADPRIAKFALAFVKAAHGIGIPCMVTEIARTADRQRTLYAAGKSKTLKSAHLVGKAVDIVHGTKAWDMTSAQWGLFGIIGHEIARRQNLKVEWGGNWKFYDPRTGRLQAGTGNAKKLGPGDSQSTRPR